MAKLKKKVKVLEYNAIFQSEEEGGYSVWITDLPGCVSQGETFEEAQRNIKESIELYLQDDADEELYNSDTRNQFMAPVHVRIHA